MASKPKSMDTLLVVLKLAEGGCKIKEIERRTGIARNTIRKYLRLLNGRVFSALTSAELNSLLYENDYTEVKSERHKILVDHFKSSSHELKQTGVTRQLLWLEYKESNPQGYEYSQYCEHLKSFHHNKDVVMHLDHIPGQEMMIDYAGDTISYVDTETGELIKCVVFVAVLPFSGRTFCIATHHQRNQDVLYCIGEALRYFGGISKIILCDNMRTLVTRSDRYEPRFTDLCYQLGAHYGNVFQATRPAKPRDKGMVEGHVRITYQQVYAPLRKTVFYSLEGLNAGLLERIDLLNNKSYKGSSYSRLSLFTEQEKEHMLPLPCQAFVMKKKVTLTVQRNYHVQLSEDHHYYSVPYIHVGQKVDVLYDHRSIEVYLHNERIALHHRTGQHSCYHTVPDHMPSNHQHIASQRGFTKEDFLLKAEKIGPYTLTAIQLVLQSSFYPEQNYKSCNGVLMLAKKYGSDRMEAACGRILQGSRVNYTLIRNILVNGMDKLQDTPSVQPSLFHENIRGSQHYI
jgi:transposase